MVTMKLFVEGGGDAKVLKTACRKGFTEFLTHAGLTRRPRILACGSRQNAYKDFCFALRKGEPAMLLIDSEAPVSANHEQGQIETWQPWEHLAQRTGDQWQKPDHASNDQCHLMVECMEAWLITDRTTLKHFFGQGFRENALPAPSRSIEKVSKADLYEALKKATCQCKTKHLYGKGEHSFELLASINPEKVSEQSKWAQRFIDSVKKKMDAIAEV